VAGAMGVRYTIYIDGYESHLYFEDNRRWFVESKQKCEEMIESA
jgi:hypothetical protein